MCKSEISINACRCPMCTTILDAKAVQHAIFRLWKSVNPGYERQNPKMKLREFHNVNCRFCGAIHDVDWANISVLSQVIHSVNERKTVQTNMISFVSHGDKTLQRLIGMPGEQEHHISSVPFFFS